MTCPYQVSPPPANSRVLTNLALVLAALTLSAAHAAPLRYVPLSPCRIISTYNATGPFGAPALSGGTSRAFTLSSGACGIPSTALAFSLNVAVVPPAPLGYLTLWPTGQSQPNTSILTSLDARTKSSAAIVAAGTGGSISFFASNATNLVVDISGYFIDSSDPSGLAFFPITPCRLVDTRAATGPFGGPSYSGGDTRSFPVSSGSCGVPASAQAYSVNLTAVTSTPLGYLTAFPTGLTQPGTSSLNDVPGTVVANAAIVNAGTGGAISIFASNATNLIIDVTGYFAPMSAGGLSLYPLPPCRILDTRQPAGSPPITGLNLDTSANSCGIPNTSQVDLLAATVLPQDPVYGVGYLALWAQGTPQPPTSILNAIDASIMSNMALVSTTNAAISAYTGNPAHLILDTAGYFAATPTPVISTLSTTSGAAGLTSVTLTGSNFGATQSTSTVTFAGVPATVITGWNPTTITAQVPVGATTGTIVVTVDQVPSNGMNFTVTPSVTTLTPSSGLTGTTILINGTNFTSTQGTVTFNGAPATVSGWSPNSIAVQVPNISAGAATVVVTAGGYASNSATFIVNIPPTLSVAVAHSPSAKFQQLATNQPYTITVSNSANALPTGGTVMVTDSIPAGLVPVSLSGTGWTCPANTVTCTRNDSLNPGASFPPITVTVNVTSSALGLVTNQATVSGGGSASATGSDPTNISVRLRYANPLAFATSASVIAGVPTTMKFFYTSDNGPSDIGSGQVTIDDCKFSWDNAQNIWMYDNTGNLVAHGRLGQVGTGSSISAGN